jgi:hypothetical protein
MSNQLSLIAFITVLLTIVILAAMVCLMAYLGKTLEAGVFTAAISGLIGIAGTFRPRAPHETDNQGKDVT